MERIAADKLNKAICFWFGECTRIEEIKRMKWHDELLPDELKKQWADTDYKQLYADFEAELISNIR